MGNHIITSVTIGNNVTLESSFGLYFKSTWFDHIGIDDFVTQTAKIISKDKYDSEFDYIATGSDYIPFDKVYKWKAGTLTLVMDAKSEKYQWGYKSK
ncbi:MAG: hypothetical protein LBB89_13920 [Treponema sp.]|jgi:hypothetical protein|nr:hypothetical protein [Treponema sp.]